MPLTITSGRRASNAGACSTAQPTLTRPAPQRSAASAVNMTAPPIPGAPPNTSTWPESPLCASRRRRGTACSTLQKTRSTDVLLDACGASDGCSAPVAERALATSDDNASGTASAAKNTRPQNSGPRPVSRPGLAAMKVTVSSARTTDSAAAPVSTTSPDGTSAAITVSPREGYDSADRSADALLMALIAARYCTRNGATKPVPRSASMMTSAAAGVRECSLPLPRSSSDHSATATPAA